MTTVPQVYPTRFPNYAHETREPTQIVCPGCRELVVTRVVTKAGKAAYTSAIAIGIIIPILFWTPFCTKSKCRDFKHYCPSCGMKVGEKEA